MRMDSLQTAPHFRLDFLKNDVIHLITQYQNFLVLILKKYILLGLDIVLYQCISL